MVSLVCEIRTPIHTTPTNLVVVRVGMHSTMILSNEKYYVMMFASTADLYRAQFVPYLIPGVSLSPTCSILWSFA